MTRILVTVGPQGAGKTTFCNALMMEKIDSVAHACRDTFLVDTFGKDAFNPYVFGLNELGRELFYKHVAKLATNNTTVLVDSFFPTADAFDGLRTELGQLLEPGFVLDFEALWFTTPPKLCGQ